MQPHQRRILSLAAALDIHCGNAADPILGYILTISIDFLLFSIMDSQTYQAEMEQWKEDLRAAREQVSMRALSNYRFT